MQVRPSDDAHHLLSEWHHYAAIAAVATPSIAAAESGAPADVHAARLAAVLGELLAELAAADRRAAPAAALCHWCGHGAPRPDCECPDGPGNAEACPCAAEHQAAADGAPMSWDRGGFDDVPPVAPLRPSLTMIEGGA